MKKIVILGIGASMFFLGSCVESSQKYKSLQARLDSLSTVHIMQNSEMESMLADLNDISAGRFRIPCGGALLCRIRQRI